MPRWFSVLSGALGFKFLDQMFDHCQCSLVVTVPYLIGVGGKVGLPVAGVFKVGEDAVISTVKVVTVRY